MKKIETKHDLAINGAPPAFDKIIHVGRPNIVNTDKFMSRINDIFERGWLTNDGPLAQEFEQKVADYMGVDHCIAICNGTIALEIAIRALELEGEVIIPSYTFIATAHALFWQGITPVFADIDPATHNLDPEAVKRMITPRTTGIIGVHLWGRAAPHDELQSIADEHGLKLMYDAAHAFGCSFKGKMIGNLGACEILSFHATKFFNTFEGGAILTNDRDLADKIRLMRNFGFAGMDNVIHPGTNGKMSEVCAAMGLTNLDYIDKVVERNYQNYKAYQKAIADIPGIRQVTYDEAENNNFQYIVFVVGDEFPAKRDEIIKALHAENILARRYFWPGCHGMKLYREMFPHAHLVLPNTLDIAARVIVLPTGMTLPDDCIDVIASVLKSFL